MPIELPFEEPSFTVIESNKSVYVWFEHDCPDENVRIAGSLPAVLWQIVVREPLTVSPSIHCQMCGLHGWIKNGKWEEV